MWNILHNLLYVGQCILLVISGCVEKADIVFLIDASGSVGSDNFPKELAFASDLVSNYTIGFNHVLIGVVTFDSAVYPQINLGQYQDVKSIQDAIQKIPYTSGGTRTDIALDFAIHEIFVPKAGDRLDAKNVLIVLTDGQSGGDIAKMGYMFKERQIQVISIGIGSNVNKQQLTDIASIPQYMFIVDDFNKLAEVTNTIHDLACNNVVITTPALQWFVG